MRTRPAAFDATARGDNPMCGDRVEVFVRRGADGTIADLGFEARGCAISVASADLMAEVARGPHARAGARALFAAVPRHGPHRRDRRRRSEPLERLAPLAGVHEFPRASNARRLPWHALVAALDGAKEASSE